MTAQTNIPGVENEVLQAAISAYSDEAYTDAKKLSGTGIVGSNPNIDVSTETFIGQVRWYKPLNPVVNVASLTDPTRGQKTNYAADFLTYVKTVRTHGAEKVNMAQVVSQQDGLAKIGRDFANTRAQDEHNAILSVLKGVAISEALMGGGAGGLGGQTFDNDPTDKKYGFYVDLGDNKLIAAPSSASQGAQRAEAILQAFGMAFKDYEPEYAYMIASPEVMASFRSANLVDTDRVTDGNMVFNTMFQGKFRLIQTRANQGLSAAELAVIAAAGGVPLVGTKTTFLVLPGALAMSSLAVPEPTEIQRDAAAYQGGGTTSIWYRWGYVLAPAGYDWSGSTEEFPSDAGYMQVKEGSDFADLADATAPTGGVWTRKSTSALSLGILPIFHK